MIYIFDIDGTLADLTHRLHFIQKEPKDWMGFFAACVQDKPIEPVIYLARLLYDVGHTLLLVSGRDEAVRLQTIAWLNANFVPYHGLHMRKHGDHRHDDIVKEELLNELCTDYSREAIQAVFEDRNAVVEMYRRNGLRVFQVADGNF